MTHAVQRFIAFLMAGVLFFSQLAVAAYACPGNGVPPRAAMSMPDRAPAVPSKAGPAGPPRAVPSAHPPMADCAGMKGRLDPAAPLLCDACCHHDQKPDPASSLHVPPVVLGSRYVVPTSVVVAVSPRLAATRLGDLMRATRSTAILHCCWRI